MVKSKYVDPTLVLPLSTTFILKYLLQYMRLMMTITSITMRIDWIFLILCKNQYFCLLLLINMANQHESSKIYSRNTCVGVIESISDCAESQVARKTFFQHFYSLFRLIACEIWMTSSRSSAEDPTSTKEPGKISKKTKQSIAATQLTSCRSYAFGDIIKPKDDQLMK